MVKNHLSDRHETLKHFVLKMLIYYRLTSLGHHVEIEYRMADDSTIDCIDFDTRLIYEIQGNMSKDIIQEKAKKYLKLVGTIDLIPIDLNSFKGWDILEWSKTIDKYIIDTVVR